MFEKGKHYNTKNGSKVACRGAGFFVPFLVFQVVSGGHGVDGFPGKIPSQYYPTHTSGEIYFRGRAKATKEQIATMDGMSVLPGEVTVR